MLKTHTHTHSRERNVARARAMHLNPYLSFLLFLFINIKTPFYSLYTRFLFLLRHILFIYTISVAVYIVTIYHFEGQRSKTILRWPGQAESSSFRIFSPSFQMAHALCFSCIRNFFVRPRCCPLFLYAIWLCILCTAIHHQQQLLKQQLYRIDAAERDTEREKETSPRCTHPCSCTQYMHVVSG